MECYREEINCLKNQLYESHKKEEISEIKNGHTSHHIEKITSELHESEMSRGQIEAELKKMREKYEESMKSNQHLKESLGSLGSQLEE